MEFTTRLELQSQTTRLVEGLDHSSAPERTGLSPSMADLSRSVLRRFQVHAPSTDHNSEDFQSELFPLHSPLLGKSWLVSFPPLSYMLKFSGYSCLIGGQMWCVMWMDRAAVRIVGARGDPSHHEAVSLTPMIQLLRAEATPRSRRWFETAAMNRRPFSGTGVWPPDPTFCLSGSSCISPVRGWEPRFHSHTHWRLSHRRCSQRRRWGDAQTLQQTYSPEGSARCVQSFDDSLIVQFALRIAFRCVLHRYGSLDIRCWKCFHISFWLNVEV